jgi:hypothetical protein
MIPDPKPITEDLLTVPEIAFLLRHNGEPLKRASVEQLRVRYRNTEEAFKGLPEPDGRIGYQPYWRLERVLAWADDLGRKYDEQAWREKRDAGGFHRHPE